MNFPQPSESSPTPETLYLKSNPKGIDVEVQRIQKSLHKKLTTSIWGTQENPFVLEGYGRIYKTQFRNETLGEAYVGKGEYQNILNAEKSKFMFIEATDAMKVNTRFYKTKIDICFIVDLPKINPGIVHRSDSEVRSDVAQALGMIGFRGDIVGYKIGVVDVFEKLKFSYADNMQPYHVFKFTIEIQYDLNATEC